MAGFNARQLQALQAMFAQKADKDEGLVSFCAGRLDLDEQTRMVTADKKRGKIKLLKDEQGILKFQWWNRISKKMELDLNIFPGSAKWEKVKECTDGRVYLLRMIGTNRKHFFWMQEPKEDKDDEYFTNINKLCNGESISDDKSKGNNDNNNNNNNSNNNAAAASNPYAAFLGGNNNNNASNNAGSAQDDLTKLLLQALQPNANQGGNNNNNQNLQQQMENMMMEQRRQRIEEMKREPDLEDILDPNANEEIIKLLDDEKIVEELGEHLPESMRSRQDIIEQLQSPQFQGSLRRLQSAINGPQMPTLLSQMGINVTNQNQMGVTAFINAIQPNNDKKSDDNDDQKDGKDDDGDTSMSNNNNNDGADKDKDKNDEDDIYK